MWASGSSTTLSWAAPARTTSASPGRGWCRMSCHGNRSQGWGTCRVLRDVMELFTRRAVRVSSRKNGGEPSGRELTRNGGGAATFLDRQRLSPFGNLIPLLCSHLKGQHSSVIVHLLVLMS